MSKAAGTMVIETMTWKLIVTFAFIALCLPHEPDLGLGPRSLMPPGLQHLHVELIEALDKVRAELKTVNR